MSTDDRYSDDGRYGSKRGGYDRKYDDKYDKYDSYDKDDKYNDKYDKYDKYDKDDKYNDKYDKYNDKYDKGDKYDKYDKYDKSDRYDKYDRYDSRYDKYDGSNGDRYQDNRYNDSSRRYDNDDYSGRPMTREDITREYKKELAKRTRTSVYIGNIPDDVREEELDDMFYKYGRIKDIDIKRARGTNGKAYAFIEFESSRDAEDAAERCDGKPFIADPSIRIRVELTGDRRPRRGGGGYGGGGSGSYSSSYYSKSSRANAPARSEHRVVVSNLPSGCRWQHLKDHMRKAGEVGYANVEPNGKGVVEYVSYEAMKTAVEKLDNSKLEAGYSTKTIKVRMDDGSHDDDYRGRSRSRGMYSRSKSRSRSRSRRRSRSASKSPRDKASRSPSKSPSPGARSKSKSRSPSKSSLHGGGDKRSRSPSAGDNPAGERENGDSERMEDCYSGEGANGEKDSME